MQCVQETQKALWVTDQYKKVKNWSRIKLTIKSSKAVENRIAKCGKLNVDNLNPNLFCNSLLLRIMYVIRILYGTYSALCQRLFQPLKWTYPINREFNAISWFQYFRSVVNIKQFINQTVPISLFQEKNILKQLAARRLFLLYRRNVCFYRKTIAHHCAFMSPADT